MTRHIDVLLQTRGPTLYAALFSLPQTRAAFLEVAGSKAWNTQPPEAFPSLLGPEPQAALRCALGGLIAAMDERARVELTERIGRWLDALAQLRACEQATSSEDTLAGVYREASTRALFDRAIERHRLPPGSSPLQMATSLSSAEHQIIIYALLNRLSLLTESGRRAYFSAICDVRFDGPPQECRHLQTRYEGQVLYCRQKGFWIRADVVPPDRAAIERDAADFWKDFETWSPEVRHLMGDIGLRTTRPSDDREFWDRIGRLWTWLADHAEADNEAYASLAQGADRWPSLGELARYYRAHGKVPWAACFSRAHLFVLLLGKSIPPDAADLRGRVLIATAHHTEGGAPPTASHVYVAVLVGGRWLYLDPSAVYSRALPPYKQRASIGMPTFTTVDYEHPFQVRTLPGASQLGVPYLGSSPP